MTVRSTIVVLWRYAPIFILLAAWQMASELKFVPDSLLPSFFDVVHRWLEFLADGEIAKSGTFLWDAVRSFFASTVVTNTAASMWRGMVGLGLSIILGVTLGIAMAWFQKLRDFFEPIVMISYPIPKPALIPIFIIWLGLGHISKIAVIFAGCLIPIVISAFNGARGVDRYLIWSARNMGTREGKLLWRVVVPASLPDILSGIRMALAISFILLVSSEMLAAKSGLGFLIFFLGESGEYAGMFAAVLTITLLGFFADRAYLTIMRRILIWREE
ncbi:MAG: ABC transporter permease [Candidatus Tectomicrobia bacterium]|nr:ABC transporter permease [Candidatus Tectomicrobia bacterium]